MDSMCCGITWPRWIEFPVLAAAAFDGTIVEYARIHDLKTKDIYQWKAALIKRGFLTMAEYKVA